MKPVRTFKVTPNIPERTGRLKDIAYNLWWCWISECIALLRRISPDLWKATEHNAVRMMGIIVQSSMFKVEEAGSECRTELFTRPLESWNLE
ncbi:MAG: DUF3417 domain-containing protein [Thermodesulfovibrionales bacterium]